HVVALDDVPAPATVADVDPGTRHFVDAAMTDGDFLRHRDLDARRLFLDFADPQNQVVMGAAAGGVVVREGAGGTVDLLEGLGLAVLKKGRRNGPGVADEADAVGPCVGDLTAADLDAAVVVADEDGVAPDLVEVAAANRASLAALEEDRPAAVDRPVAAQE